MTSLTFDREQGQCILYVFSCLGLTLGKDPITARMERRDVYGDY